MYIVIEIQTSEDGAVGNLVWAFDSLEQAESKYHSVLSDAAVSKLPCHACVILKNDGGSLAVQAYKHGKE